MTKESIIAKVKKLMAIADNDASSDHEIDTALNFAKKLMDNHHLTEDDLAHEPDDDYEKARKADKGLYRSFVGTRMFTWEVALGWFVSEFVGCPWYCDQNLKIVRNARGFAVIDPVTEQPKKGKSFVFYGIAEDAAIAQEVYNEMRSLIATMAVSKWGNCYRGDGAAYAEGFVAGLETKLKKARIEEKKQTESTALILLSHRRDELIKVKNEIARDWLQKEKGVTLSKGQQRAGSNGSLHARKEGYTDGQNTDVSATRMKKLG